MKLIKRRFRIFAVIAAPLILLGLLNGCASMYDNPDDNQSDIPWNTPQAWEGTPALPGIGDRGL
jgi:hypothetical protein